MSAPIVPVLETPRLRLRPFTLGDLDAHARLYADPEITRWLSDGPWSGAVARARSARAVRRFVTQWAERGFGVWVVEDRAGGRRFVGQCGLNVMAGGEEVEILWALERAAWGQGRATEAARAALAHGFEVVGLRRVVAIARPDNARSRAIMAKLGMRWEKDVVAFGARAVYYAVERGR